MLIYDVGMHNGDDTAYYLAKGARVVAIEANSGLCEAASRRFAAEIAAGQLTILNIAVGDGEGDVSFYVSQTNSVLSSLEPIGQAVRITVRLRRLSDVFDEHGLPDFAKIDVEHVDHLVLAELHRNDRLPPSLSIEAHREEVIKGLIAAGYRSFRMVNCAKVHVRFETHDIETVSGDRLAWKFQYHSSGPFGADLPGDWLDADALRTLWYRRGRKLGHGWFDVHARKAPPTVQRDAVSAGPAWEPRARSIVVPTHWPPAGVAELRRARVFMRPDWNALVPGSGLFVRSSYSGRHKYFARQKTLGRDNGVVIHRRPSRRIPAETPVVLIGGDANFYHHLLDYLARLFTRDDPWPAEARFLIIEDVAPFHRPLREFFGLTDDRVIFGTATPEPWLCERLLLPAGPLNRKGRVVDRVALDRMRAFVLGRIPASGDRPERIYIARSQNAGRQLAEDRTLWERLRALGFRRVVLEEMSFADQVATFASARTIVAAHGAGLTNMVFAPPGAEIVEIMPSPGRYADYFLNFAPGCGHRITRIAASGELRAPTISVDVDAVMEVVTGVLDHAIKGRAAPPSGRRPVTLPVAPPPVGTALEIRGARVMTYPDWNVIAPGSGAYVRPSRHSKPRYFRLVADASVPTAEVSYHRPGRRVSATTPVVLLGGDRNYYHHLVDFMLRLFAVPDPWPDGAKFLLSRDFHPFHRRMREFFGLTDDKVIIHDDDNVPLRCDRLLLPPSPVGPKGRVNDPRAIERLRSAVLDRIGPLPAPSRLFVSRGPAASRRLVNEAELWARLEPLGFRRVVLEELTFEEQVAAFATAESVVAVHGAGLANIVFSPPGALVVQIMPDPGELFAGYFNRLAPGCGHRIVDVPADGRREDAEVRVNVDDVMRALPWRPAAPSTSTASHDAPTALAFAAPAFAHVARVGLRATLSVAQALAGARLIEFELHASGDGGAPIRRETRDVPAPDPAGAAVEVAYEILDEQLPRGQHLLRATLRDADGKALAEAQAIVAAFGIEDLPLHPALATPLRSTTLAALPLIPMGPDVANHPGDVRIEMRKPSDVPLVKLTQPDVDRIRAAGGPAKRFSLPSYPLNGLYVASLEAPTVFGQFGTVATRDGVVGESWMDYHPRIPPIYQLRAFFKRPSAVEDCGDVGMWWGAPWRTQGHNYYHTHGEALCALLQLEMFRDLSGVPEFDILMPERGGWPGEAIELMGIDRVRFIGDRALRPRRLYWASAVLRHNLGIEPLLRQVFRRVRLGAERRRLAGQVATPPAMAGAEMIYVSRLDTTIRPMRNEADLIAALEARGVRTFVSRGLSYAEQVLAMSQARVVIGPHGAGLTNMGYARPDALVVEIHPSFYVTPLFFRMSQVLGQRYRCFTQPTTPIPGDDAKAWTIDVGGFLDFLDRALDQDAAARARSSGDQRLDGAA